jgi:hypothetical protein
MEDIDAKGIPGWRKGLIELLGAPGLAKFDDLRTVLLDLLKHFDPKNTEAAHLLFGRGFRICLAPLRRKGRGA